MGEILTGLRFLTVDGHCHKHGFFLPLSQGPVAHASCSPWVERKHGSETGGYSQCHSTDQWKDRDSKPVQHPARPPSTSGQTPCLTATFPSDAAPGMHPAPKSSAGGWPRRCYAQEGMLWHLNLPQKGPPGSTSCVRNRLQSLSNSVDSLSLW